jgi:hypothetical protein
MPLKVLPFQKLNNILRTYLPIEDVFLILNTSVESEEPDKPLNSVKHSEDGLKNPSELFSD